MPWCPRCDEVFPEGPACPRCRAALVEVPGSKQSGDAQPVPLPEFRVPRRLRRAFGAPVRQQPPPPPPRHIVAVAVAVVLIASGFVLGRMSAEPVDSPAMRLPPAAGLRAPVDGTLTYLRAGPLPVDFVLVRSLMQSGGIEPAGRFSSPFGGAMERADVTGLDGSVAVVVSRAGRSAVAAFPDGRVSVSWLPGNAAAWEDADTLLVLDGEAVTRWRFDERVAREQVDGAFSQLLQTPGGAALVSGGLLRVTRADGLRDAGVLPHDSVLLASATDGRTSLVRTDAGVVVWDGDGARPAQIGDGYSASAAAVSPDAQRIAVVVRDAGSAQQLLAVLDRSGGRITLVPLASGGPLAQCELSAAWDASGRWVLVATADRSVHAVEVGGADEAADLHNAGCGVVWSGEGGAASRPR